MHPALALRGPGDLEKEGLGPVNAVAWDVDEGMAEAFARKRDQGDFPDA